MESRTHKYHGNTVHSIKFGHGTTYMFAFHGYADRARLFSQLESVLGEHYTVIAIDLPFHGQTEWAAHSFTKADIEGIIEMYCTEEHIESFALMGYSFGARIVQAMLPTCIRRTTQLILLAPDGIATRGLSAAIYTPMWARKLAFKLIKNPTWFMAFMSCLKNIHVLPANTWLFLDKNLATPERYHRTFGMWFSLDNFWLRRSAVNALLNSHPIDVDIFFGKKDAFVKYKGVNKLATQVKHVRLHLLDSGHRIFGAELSARLKVVLEKTVEV